MTFSFRMLDFTTVASETTNEVGSFGFSLFP